MKRIGQRRGGPPPAAPRDLVVVLRPDTPASPPLLAAARGNGGTVAVVLPLKIHGYAFGLPNPGLLPTAKERAAAEAAITTTVRRFERAGIDVDGQIVVTRHAARAIARIVRRRGATRVLLEPPTGGRLRRLIEGDPQRQISRRVRRAATVDTAAEAPASLIP
ncbi:MAG: hypothetical protein QOE41_2697 [Mycobacterium sp.]|jgi:hypothetical protein|nr:hypothetical protein [Mycobacterium sp.]